ncbi:MAG: TFIIB-type zinc ribbon-containing protein, partial [Nanoarchaeota archaeon]
MSYYVKKCPECQSTKLFINRDKGEVICKDCGLVVEDKMVEMGQEWREFEGDSGGNTSGRRTGAPMTYTKYDRGLGTDV